MAVTVNIGSTNDAANVISKTTNLRDGISANLKQPCDVERPIFILSSSLVSTADNYLYCPDFHRYYYITDISEQPGQAAVVSCEVDALKTYEDEIRALRVNVSRTENTDFSNIPDSQLVTLSKDEVVYLNLSSSIPRSTAQDYSYLLITAG